MKKLIKSEEIADVIKCITLDEILTATEKIFASKNFAKRTNAHFIEIIQKEADRMSSTAINSVKN